MWNSCGFPVGHPLVAAGQAAQTGHAADSADAPVGGVGFQAATDQVVAGPLDRAAANAAALAETFCGAHAIRVRREIASQLVEGFSLEVLDRDAVPNKFLDVANEETSLDFISQKPGQVPSNRATARSQRSHPGCRSGSGGHRGRT